MDNGRLRALAELAVKVGANVGEGQYVLVTGLVEHAPLVRGDRRRLVRGRRALRGRAFLDQHVRRSMIEKGPDEVLEWSPDWAVKRIDDLGNEQRSADHDHRRSRARAAQRPRSGARRQGAAREDRGGVPAPRDGGQHQLDDRQLPEQGLGADDLRRAGRRAALEGRRARDPPRRARSGRCVERAHRAARRTLPDAERAPLRRDPLPRAGHRPDGRAQQAVALGVGGLGDGVRPPSHPEHPDRRGLHDARLAPDGGNGSLHDAARAAREHHPRPRASLRRRSRRRRQGVDRRGVRARAARGRRRRRSTRRDRARRRHVARRPDRSHLLQHAVRRERDVPHRLRARDQRVRRGQRASWKATRSKRRASTSRPCTPTS